MFFINFFQVFAYGSVPLKTYLPDGDIDLSAVGVNTHDLINEIASLLDREGKNNSAEFVVKDVQVIGAEVFFFKYFLMPPFLMSMGQKLQFKSNACQIQYNYDVC